MRGSPVAFGAHFVQLINREDDQDAVFGDVWRGYTVACDASLPDHGARCER